MLSGESGKKRTTTAVESKSPSSEIVATQESEKQSVAVNDEEGISKPVVRLGPKMIIKVKINEMQFSALIDSGATISALHPSVLESLGRNRGIVREVIGLSH